MILFAWLIIFLSLSGLLTYLFEKFKASFNNCSFFFNVKKYKFVNFFIWYFFEPIYDVLGVFPLIKTKMLPHCSHYIHAHTYSHQNRILCKSYSRCSSNLRESLLNFMVDIKIFWFFLPLNFSLSYKIKSWNLLSFSIEKELSISSKSFIRVDLFAI